jgi:zinc-finger-containing domain
MKTQNLAIYCCGCGKYVDARLINGKEAYPHRRDLYSLPFWKCDTCKNIVGCHHRTKDRTRPVGVIATPELRKVRRIIHETLDPLWKNKHFTRKHIYNYLARKLDISEYHTGETRTIEEAMLVYSLLQELVAQAANGDTNV